MRTSVIVLASAVTLAVASTASARAVADPSTTVPTPARAVGAAATATRTVDLLTGDAVAVSHRNGRPMLTVSLRSHTGVAGHTLTYSAGGDTYVVPGAALRYLDRVLDRSLFDVTALARRAAGTPTTVRLTLAPGTTPTVPGLTVTAHSAGTEQGYFTAAGAQRFGAALAAAWTSDTRAHRSSASLFGGVTGMAVAGAVVARPTFQQYTLKIRVLDPTGAPADFAFVGLVNVDDGRRFTNFVEAVNGVANVSVPAGHYAGLTEYDAFTADGLAAYLIPVDNVSVFANNQTMVFDARTATTVPSVSTPHPANALAESLEWDRAVPNGGISASFGYGPGTAVHVRPTGPITRGGLDWVTSWSLAATPSSGRPYSYDLSFDDSGAVPADQARMVDGFQLARIDSRYYTDATARDAAFGRGAFYPFQFFGFTQLFATQIPLHRDEYVYAPASARWTAALVSAPNDLDPFQGLVTDGDRAYQAGTGVSADWGRGPLAPGIVAQTPGEQFFLCAACQDADGLTLFFAPYVDTTSGHAGTFDLLDDTTVAADFVLYRNGTKIDDLPNATGDEVAVPTSAATYRAVVSTARGLVGFGLSTAATEDVTFRSAAGSGAMAPTGWICVNAPLPCTVLPLLQASVPLPTDLEGTLPLGATPVTFRVGHIQGATDPAVSGVAFAVSVNGTSYQSVPVTSLGSGRYAVTLHNGNASAGHPISIRITAQDAAGGKLTETVQNAFVVSAS